MLMLCDGARFTKNVVSCSEYKQIVEWFRDYTVDVFGVSLFGNRK